MTPRLACAIGIVALLSACTQESTPAPAPTPTPPAPTVTAVTITGFTGPGSVGQSADLVATAALSDGTTQAVTPQATWTSSDAGMATVSAAGRLEMVAAGDVEIKAVYRSVTGSLRLTIAPRPAARFALRGATTDSVNGRGVRDVLVSIVDGANAGRSVLTDADGQYTLTDLITGTFTARFFQSFYDRVDRQITLSADTRLDIALKPALDVSAFYGTYNISLSVARQNCEFPVEPGTSGQLVLSGRQDGSGFTARLIERGTTRQYDGSMRVDGRFSGSGSGTIGFAAARLLTWPLIYSHSYSGGIDGTVSGRSVSGTESITYGDPCPGKVLQIGFSGSR